MKRFLLIAALLTACGPSPDAQRAKEFGAFPVARAGDAACLFHPPGQSVDDVVIFSTVAESSDAEAFTYFGAETLRLLPKNPPVFDGRPVDVTYDVYDYQGWEVRVQVEPTGTAGDSHGYFGTITMLELDVSAEIEGSCGV